MQVNGELTSTSYGKTLNAIVAGTGTIQVDLALGNVASITVTGSVTLEFITTLVTTDLTLLITNGNTSVTWPTDVKWDNGSVPTLTSVGEDVLTFIKIGSFWYGNSYILDAQTV